MDLLTLSEWAKPLGVVVGVILALWTLAQRLDKVLLAHLTATFATKHDFDRLETKVDTLVNAMWVESRRTRSKE